MVVRHSKSARYLSLFNDGGTYIFMTYREIESVTTLIMRMSTQNKSSGRNGFKFICDETHVLSVAIKTPPPLEHLFLTKSLSER